MDTGFVDGNLTKICVGDRIRTPEKSCGCNWLMCTVEYNTDWSAYGLKSDDGRWISGMGIVCGLFVEDKR
jgi:hypothetical protein